MYGKTVAISSEKINTLLYAKSSQQLLHLLKLAAKDDDSPGERRCQRLEKAMRIWAIHDTRAMTSIERVDRQRLDYLQHLFLQIGFSSIDAELRAQVTYSVKLGWVTIAPPRKPSERLAEMRFIHKILTQVNTIDGNPSEVDRYIAG